MKRVTKADLEQLNREIEATQATVAGLRKLYRTLSAYLGTPAEAPTGKVDNSDANTDTLRKAVVVYLAHGRKSNT